MSPHEWASDTFAADATERRRILAELPVSVVREEGEDVAAYACGIPGSAAWLCTDLQKRGEDTLARQVAELGGTEGDRGACYYLGIFLEEEGDLEAAIEVYRRAIPLPQAAWRWGNALRLLGDEAGAAQVFADHARADPECAVAFAQTDGVDLEEARAVLTAHLRNGVLDSLIPLSLVYEELGRDEESRECLRLSLLSGEPHAPWNYARSLEERDTDAKRWVLLAAREGDEIAVAGAAERYGRRWRRELRPGAVAKREEVLGDVGTVSLW